jgi:hypothetical protein
MLTRRKEVLDLSQGESVLILKIKRYYRDYLGIDESKLEVSLKDGIETVALPNNYYSDHPDVVSIDEDIAPNTKVIAIVNGVDVEIHYRRLNLIEVLNRLSPTWEDFSEGMSEAWKTSVSVTVSRANVPLERKYISDRFKEILNLRHDGELDSKLTTPGRQKKFAMTFPVSPYVLEDNIFDFYPKGYKGKIFVPAPKPENLVKEIASSGLRYNT